MISKAIVSVQQLNEHPGYRVELCLYFRKIAFLPWHKVVIERTKGEALNSVLDSMGMVMINDIPNALTDTIREGVQDYLNRPSEPVFIPDLPPKEVPMDGVPTEAVFMNGQQFPQKHLKPKETKGTKLEETKYNTFYAVQGEIKTKKPGKKKGGTRGKKGIV